MGLYTTTTLFSTDTSPPPTTSSSLTSPLESTDFSLFPMPDLPKSLSLLDSSRSHGCQLPNTTETTELDTSDLTSKTQKKRPVNSTLSLTTDVPLCLVSSETWLPKNLLDKLCTNNTQPTTSHPSETERDSSKLFIYDHNRD